MSWAGRRRAFIILIASLLALSALLILFFAIFYKVPTCTDHKKNQDEVGVDCGGACTTLCSSQVGSAPVVNFVRALAPQPGRTDVVALVENRNSDAEAHNAPFNLEVYGADHVLIVKKTITIDLPALSSVPVYLADVAPAGSVASQAFLTPATESVLWVRASATRPVLPTVENITPVEGPTPRITATLVNPLARTLYNTTLIAIVHDASDTVIGSSETLVPTLPSQGTAPMVFTWNQPFSAPVARVEILPVPTFPKGAL